MMEKQHQPLLVSKVKAAHWPLPQGIHIAIIRNPFGTDRSVIKTDFMPGKRLHEYVQPFFMGAEPAELVYSRNGKAAEAEDLPENGDYIAAMPVIEKGLSGVLKSLLSVALVAWAGGLSAKTFWGMNSFWSSVVGMSASMIGGALLNHVFPTKTDTAQQSDPNYVWNTTQSQTGQGYAQAVTFGTVLSAGAILAQHVEGDGTEQYMTLLIGAGEGELDAIEDIKINDNPINYYTDVAAEIRLGTNDQTAITIIPDTYADQPLSYELVTEGNWSTHTTEGDGGQGLEITVEFPNGLYKVKDSGSLTTASVVIAAQYRLTGATTWTDWQLKDEGRISGKTSSSIRKSYSITAETGRYEVRVRCVQKSGTSTKYSTRVYWTQLSHIIYDKFSRPGRALIGLKALATSQLSNNISVTFKKIRSKVWVWNPNTNSYVQKPADNPAWANYEMFHRCKRLKNINTGQYEFVVYGRPANRFIYQDFEDWAAFCAERGLTFNFEFTSADTLWKQKQIIEAVGRGKVIMRGTRLSCIFSGPKEAVQLFTVGNIVADSFTEDFKGITEKANAVEISFKNADNNFNTDCVSVYSTDYNEEDVFEDPTQITLDGCTDIQQVYRHGAHLLKVAQLNRTVEIEADIDAIACQMGDCVLLQHDVPEWGYGGRILAATANAVTLDRKVKMTPGQSYQLLIHVVNTATGTETNLWKTVRSASVDTETNTITVNEAFDVIPTKHSVYSFGPTNKVVKPFTIVSIDRAQKLTRKLTLLEYIEEVYIDDAEVPEINYSNLDTELAEVNNLSLGQYSYQGDNGFPVFGIDVSWSPPSNRMIERIRVSYREEDDVNWTAVPEVTEGNSVSIGGLFASVNYYIKVQTISALGLISTGKIAGPLYITDMEITPEHVEISSVNEYQRNLGDGQPTNELRIIFVPPETQFYRYSEIYIKDNQPSVEEYDLTSPEFYDVPVENVGAMLNNWTLVTGTAVNEVTIRNLTKGVTYYVKIVAVTTTGDKADFDTAPVVTHTIQGKIYIPTTPDNFTVSITDKVECTWNPTADTDRDFYELRTDQNPGMDAGKLAQTVGTKATPTLAERQGTLYLYAHNTAGTVGKYSVPASYSYYKAPPTVPQNVVITGVFQGFRLTTEALPTHCIGINVHVDGQVYFSNNNTYTYEARSGIFQIQVAFVDIFGEGALSPVELVEVQSQIAIGELEDAAQEAIEKAQKSVAQETFDNAMVAVNDAFRNVDTALETVNEAVELVDSAVVALDEAKVSKVEFTETKNELAQADTDNRTLISQTSESLGFMAGKLESAPDAPNQFASIAAVNVKADGIAAAVEDAESNIAAVDLKADQIIQTVSSNKTAAENSIAAVNVRADGIAQTVANNKTATDNSIAEVNVKADQISQTVASNKQDADSKINTLTGQINLVPGKITAAVTEAKQDITNNQIAPVVTRVAAVELGVNGITSTVAANKQAQDSINAQLQNQIDGSITTWFYAGVPTLSNAPANTWTTAAVRDVHLGDLYYDTNNKKAYRFMKTGTVYSWDLISDTDVTAALDAAQKAQDTADSKRRVFTATPTPPYDVGDLWTQGTGGELMRCKTKKTTGQAYAAADWEKASKYTDDTYAKTGNLYLRGTGLNRNATRILTINDSSVYNATGRGLRLVTINRSSLSVVEDILYDVYLNATVRTSLADKLNSLTDNVLVTLTSQDAIVISGADLIAALQRVGGTGNAVNGRYPFALVGLPGIGTGNGIEVCNGIGASDPYAEITTKIANGTPQGFSSVGKTLADAAQAKAIGELNSFISGIYATDKQGVQSQINQQSNQISSIVTSTLANTQVTAILQMLQGLYFRAADGSLQSLLVITPTEVYINTGYLRIAANTKIDGNVIASGMIKAKAVQAGHLESNTVSAMFANFGTFVSAGADGSKTTISGPLITVHHPNGKLAARFGRW